MRILFTSIHEMGHIIPLLPLASGLKRRGHEVAFSCPPELQETITDSGFRNFEVDNLNPSERRKVDQAIETLPLAIVGRWRVSNEFMGSLAIKALPKMIDNVRNWSPSLIVRETCEFAGPVAGELCGVPTVRVEVLNGQAEEGIVSRLFGTLDQLRISAGLNPDKGRRLRAEYSLSAHPKILNDTPRRLSKEPFRYQTLSNINLCVRDAEKRKPKSEATVYATFGTALPNIERVNHLFLATLAALGRLPVRSIFTAGALATTDPFLSHPPRNVSVQSFANQDKILEKSEVVVCHGGSGTVIGALCHAVPLVVIPVAYDQIENAKCLERAGLAYVVDDIFRDNLSEQIFSSITRALSDEGLRERMISARNRIFAMPTIEDALDKLLSNAK